MRRKLTVVEQAIKDAAAELGLPKDHWNVERYATLQVMLKVARHKWSQDQASSAASEMLSIMDAISAMRREAGIREPLQLNMRVVESYVGIADITCPHCGKASRHELSDKPFDAAPTSSEISTRVDTAPTSPETGSQTPSTDAPAPAESDSNTHSNPPPANVVPLTVAAHRGGVSASPFHNALLSNGEIAPLKYRQPSHYHTADHDPHPYYNADGTPRVLTHKLPT